jgi:hypothetical protein
MFRSYDHHQDEKYIATLGLLNWHHHHTILTLRRRIKTHIIRYHTRNRMQTPQIKKVLESSRQSITQQKFYKNMF